MLFSYLADKKNELSIFCNVEKSPGRIIEWEKQRFCLSCKTCKSPLYVFPQFFYKDTNA